MKQDTVFYSVGSKIAAHLYLPDRPDTELPSPTGAVVLCHGFAGVKEMLLPAYAQAFADAGYVALTFDYRGFGESEGIEGYLSPKNQIEDIRNAITYIQTVQGVDPNKIALWGSSYGGANGIVTAAQDKRVSCLLVQLTFGDGERVITGGKTRDEIEKIKSSIQRIWTKEVTTNKGMKLGVNRFLTDEQSLAFYNKYVTEFPALKVKIPFLTMKETMEHKPEKVIIDVTAPIMITYAQHDKVNPPSESLSLYEKANDPKSLVEIPNATHYDVYEGDHLQTAIKHQLAWLDAHL